MDYHVDTIEAAKFLGLKPDTLKKWRHFDKGPKWVKLGGAVRYKFSELEKWAAKGDGRDEK